MSVYKRACELLSTFSRYTGWINDEFTLTPSPFGTSFFFNYSEAFSFINSYIDKLFIASGYLFKMKGHMKTLFYGMNFSSIFANLFFLCSFITMKMFYHYLCSSRRSSGCDGLDKRFAGSARLASQLFRRICSVLSSFFLRHLLFCYYARFFTVLLFERRTGPPLMRFTQSLFPRSLFVRMDPERRSGDNRRGSKAITIMEKMRYAKCQQAWKAPSRMSRSKII